MWQILDGGVFIIDIITLPLLCKAVFELRVKPPLLFLGVAISGSLWYLILISLSWPNILFKLPINTLWTLAIISLYKGSFFHRISVALVYTIIHAAIDVFLYGIIIEISGVTMQEILDNVNLSAYYSVLGHITLFGICFLLARVLEHHKQKIHMPVWEWLSILLIISSSTLELYFVMYAINDSNSLFSLFPLQAVMLLFVNVALLLLFNRLSSQSRLAQENIKLQEQMRYNRLNLQAAGESYRVQRSLTHDFKNRLLTIEQLLKSDKQKDALEYVETVQDLVAEMDVAVSTNNPIADAVLNQKYRQAREKGIGMQFLVSDLSRFPLTADEMVTVLSNLLDNAIEACERQKSEEAGEGGIRVKLLMESSLVTLSVQNSSLPVTVSHEGEVVTSKKNPLEHGFGIKNCRKILRRSGFDFVAQYKDGRFQFTAMKAL